jgi:hypothetical protein
VVRPPAGHQVVLHGLQAPLVFGDQVNLVRPPRTSADANHLVLDAKAAVG